MQNLEVLKTQYLIVDPKSPESKQIKKAAGVIKKGGLVAFPTETVYGLGADGLNTEAVNKIFQVKGRPRKNPLILHVSSLDQAKSLSSNWPQTADILAKSFWPGPITLILPRAEGIPDAVTAGLPTIALRYPSSPIALALIEASGVPIAAPSANLSGRPSPTRAEDVLADLNGKIDMILDGGPAEVGVESTILSLTGEQPVLLRPGGITREEIEDVLKKRIIVPDAVLSPDKPAGDDAAPCPGYYFKHYAPRAQVIMVTGEPEEQAAKVEKYLTQNRGKRIGVLATSENYSLYRNFTIPPFYLASLGSRYCTEEIANHLFSALRDCDRAGVEVILVETVAPEGMGLAVMNRLCRAAEQQKI
ncbi:MAG TPA: threonylcarbamoyl-AMP synthase [Syntrophaceticus sp.]|nr:threonylcarbamoyl-AMP synthase [Syntrophaceticus sp.]